MPRRGENIRKRKDGRWEARYIKDYHEDGSAHYGYLYAKTYTEVKAKKLAVLAAPAKTETTGKRSVFDAAVTEWLACQKHSVKQSTYSRYRRIADTHIRPDLGGVRLRQISRALLDGYVDKKLTSGRLNGKGGLAPKTVRDILSVLRQILSYAGEQGYLSGEDLKLKSPKKNSREIEVLTPAEQTRFEGYLTSVFDTYRLGVFLCLYTGLRIGELCALRWCDIHFDTGVLCVRHTIQRIDNPDPSAKSKTIVIIDTPKTESSLREIPLSSFLLAQLQHYSMYAALPGAYLLTGESRYIEPRSLYNKYKGFLAECGIGDYTFHALRHTFATRSIEKGFDPKSLSEVLGHADVAITLKLYVHPSMDLKRSYMERLTAAHSWSGIGVPECCPSA